MVDAAKVNAINPTQDEHFWDCSWMGEGGKKTPPLLKMCHTHPTMMKIGKFITYLKKIQKLYESSDTPPEFY